MNYFGHGHRFIDNPFFLAGTAVPDWLSVVNRRVRARRRLAEPYTQDPDPARGRTGRRRVSSTTTTMPGSMPRGLSPS